MIPNHSSWISHYFTPLLHQLRFPTTLAGDRTISPHFFTKIPSYTFLALPLCSLFFVFPTPRFLPECQTVSTLPMPPPSPSLDYLPITHAAIKYLCLLNLLQFYPCYCLSIFSTTYSSIAPPHLQIQLPQFSVPNYKSIQFPNIQLPITICFVR